DALGALVIDRAIVIDGVVNLRDLGGVATAHGRTVRRGLVFRSGHLGELVATVDGEAAALDHAAFERTGIREVFDLRTQAEVVRSPDRVPDGVRVTHLDVLEDATQSIATHLEEMFADPAGAPQVLATGVIDRHYEQTYRNLIRLDSA